MGWEDEGRSTFGVGENSGWGVKMMSVDECGTQERNEKKLLVKKFPPLKETPS